MPPAGRITGAEMSYYAKLTVILIAAFALVALVLFYFWYESNAVRVVRYKVTLPEGFRGFRIVQISDLHNHRYGRGQRRLLRLIQAERPDMIAVTGDMIHNEYTAHALTLAERAAGLCPVYYVSGNHECILSFCGEFYAALRDRGVVVLDDESRILTRGGSRIRLIGLSDPMSHEGLSGGRARRAAAAETLKKLAVGDEFRLLLSHRPEMFADYADVDLVLAGHAHAGQVRLPFVGAVFSPGEGFRPRYDVGRFTEGRTTMIVSGGLGSSNIVPRFNNRPQLVVIEGE